MQTGQPFRYNPTRDTCSLVFGSRVLRYFQVRFRCVYHRAFAMFEICKTFRNLRFRAHTDIADASENYVLRQRPLYYCTSRTVFPAAEAARGVRVPFRFITRVRSRRLRETTRCNSSNTIGSKLTTQQSWLSERRVSLRGKPRDTRSRHVRNDREIIARRRRRCASVSRNRVMTPPPPRMLGDQ